MCKGKRIHLRLSSLLYYCTSLNISSLQPSGRLEEVYDPESWTMNGKISLVWSLGAGGRAGDSGTLDSNPACVIHELYGCRLIWHRLESVTEMAAEVLPFHLVKLVRPGIPNRPLWLGCSPLTPQPVSTLDQTAPGDPPSRSIPWGSGVAHLGATGSGGLQSRTGLVSCSAGVAENAHALS